MHFPKEVLQNSFWEVPITDLMPRLTPASLTELWEAFERKLEELTVRDARDPRAAQVVLLTAGLPLAPRDLCAEPEPDDSAPGKADVEGAS
jgi:hypothetical protein